MLLKAWFLFAAVVCGFVVGWLVDGRQPPLLVFLVVCGALTLGTMAQGRLRLHRRPAGPPAPTPAPQRRAPATRQPAPKVSREPRESAPRRQVKEPAKSKRAHEPTGDEALVGQLLSTVRPDDLTRLRSQDFTSAWHKRELAPYQQLLDLTPSLARLSDSDVVYAVRNLLDRTVTFLEYHDEYTVADPLVGSDEWLVVAAENGGRSTNGAGRAGSLPAELRARAAEIANAYDELVMTAARKQCLPAEAPTARTASRRRRTASPTTSTRRKPPSA